MSNRLQAVPSGTPWGAIVSVVMGLLYGVSPIDLIPDIIPLLGWSDDIVVMGLLFFYAFVTFRRRRRQAQKVLQPVAWRPKR